MNDRINYLKTITQKETADISAYGLLTEKEYTQNTETEEILRKAQFLMHFAEKIPVVMDENELIVGSMRFWHAGVSRNRNKGHIIVDYRMILREGVEGIRNRISRLDTVWAGAFGEAFEAFSLFIQRYADTALEMNRKDVAHNCKCLTEGAPKTFYQALQLVWFVHLFLHAEGMAAAVSFGRFDDYMYPFYKNDIEKGVLTRKEAKELLMCFFLKTCEGDESQNLTLGGNIENDLTLLCLEAAIELRVQQPSISVRICDETSDAVWKKIIEFVKCKTGMPAIFNDTTIIKALENAKVEKKDAQNYAIVGCYEANSDGNTFGTTANAGMFYLHDVLLGFLSLDKAYTNFEDFYGEFKSYFTNKYNTDILCTFRRNWENIQKKCISPFQSACMGDCLESGIPAELGGCKYTMAGINILGIGTLIDSIYTIRKLVFENKEYSYTEFVQQVRNNFPSKALSDRCKNLEGKYGTDHPETNEMASDLSAFIANLVENGTICEGVTAYAGLFGFLQDVYSGGYPATPDGRLKGERISYGVGCSDFCTAKTITSVLNSAAHIANDRFADGNPLMFNISEKELEGEKGDALLKALIQGYFAKGGFHLQINVTDAETLRKAKENPAEYKDLIVRISGYSAHFTKLNDAVQTALIERSR